MFLVTNPTSYLDIQIHVNDKNALFRLLNSLIGARSITIHKLENNIEFYIDQLDQTTIEILNKVLDIKPENNYDKYIKIKHINQYILLKIYDNIKLIIDCFSDSSLIEYINKLNSISSKYELPTINTCDIEKYFEMENRIIRHNSIIYLTNNSEVIKHISDLFNSYKYVYLEEFIFNRYVYLNGLIFTKELFENIINEKLFDDLLFLLKCTKKIRNYFDQSVIIKTEDMFSAELFSIITPLKYSVGIINDIEKYDEIVNHAKLRMM
jgi:hypothetical protein